jgi:hypothetical protein
LLADPQGPAQEVDYLDLQAEGLAVAQPGPGGQHHQRPVPLGHGRDQGLDPLGGQRLDPLRLRLRESDINTR